MTPIIATSNGNSSNFEPCPAGNHVARCYSMVHIGTIDDTYLGEAHTANKVRISFEFPTEKRVFKEESGEQPYALSKEFTLSMHEKSNLRKVLEGWRGKAFTEDEAKAFDITKLLGVPCLVNVIHKEKKDGTGVRAEIASISALPKGFTCPEQINPSVVFTVNDFNWDIFETFPEWIKEKIRSSREYKAMQKPQQKTDKAQAAQILPAKDHEPTVTENEEQVNVNDLPFEKQVNVNDLPF